nr:MAG TPA: hypothetical protein [Caudoviricetes sp.]
MIGNAQRPRNHIYQADRFSRIQKQPLTNVNSGQSINSCFTNSFKVGCYDYDVFSRLKPVSTL